MASPGPEGGPYRRESGVISPRPVRSRTHSISSDRPSTITNKLLSPPSGVSPEAAFIASSAASQIVTNDHDSHADAWYDEHGVEPAAEPVVVSPAALQLVNSFLDQLLFSFLQISKGTSLSALRPAVSDVLKPKLAKDAINNADEELREYLGGADEDNIGQPSGAEQSRDWDLELVWKRTRLRCMVYSSLGDMEEEDEDLYMEQENLEIGADEQSSEVISPAVAIFLTSVMEYMGELTLTVAGQAAYHRLRTKFEKDIKEGTRVLGDSADPIVVEELDMERVALDRTLGRLWRGWKKRIRTPTLDSLGRQMSMRSLTRHFRSDSQESLALRMAAVDPLEDHMEEPIAEDVQPKDIPLPMRDTDVDEIEVPGLVQHSDDEDDVEETIPEAKRPRSLHIPSNIAKVQPNVAQIPHPLQRKRTGSLPHAGFNPYFPRQAPVQPEQEDTSAVEAKPEESMPAQPSDNLPQQTLLAVARDERDENGVSPLEEEDPLARAGRQPRIGSGPVPAAESVSPFDGVTPSGELESEDEDVHYEQAEIITSARVSMTGSASPTPSEFDKLERTSSRRSARIVTVPQRPSSYSGNNGAQSPRMVQEETLAQLESESRETTAPAKAAPTERARSNGPTQPIISESDEESDFFPSELRGIPARIPPSGRNPYAQSVRQYAPAKHDAPSNTKVTILGNANGNFESIPEVPARAPGHSVRQQSRESSLDKTRSRESEETASYSPQSNGNAARPTHASGSSVSSNTGRLKAVRTSEENYRRAEHVARNFEDLIQSNQTITYTLTPENMRDHSKPSDSSVHPQASRKNDDPRPHHRSRSSSGTNEPQAVNRRPSQPGVDTNYGVPAGTGPRGSSLNGPRSPGYARDARVPTDNTADFADFIKSTGPPGDSRPLPVKNVGQVPRQPSTEARRSSTASNRGRYQPRDATVSEKSDNSDLIDFIRQGPPSVGNNNNNNHRIPRHVAPFRNTMDSDQMAGGNGGRAVDATIPEIRHSQASTSITENCMPSVQSSINSNSALLKKNGPAMPGNMFDEEDMMPKRKQRRVRDPYAIDSSDEEEDDEDAELFASTTPKPPVKQEESLADFLRNYDPPPAPPVQPAAAPKQPKKKMSSTSLMARLRNTYARESVSSPPAPKPSTVNNDAARQRSHVPIQVSMPSGYDRYGPVETPAPSNANITSNNMPRMMAASGGSGRVPMKKFEPREAVSSNTRTSDLADFFRDSEPPPGMNNSFGPSPMQDDSNGSSRVFGRRKKPSFA